MRLVFCLDETKDADGRPNSVMGIEQNAVLEVVPIDHALAPYVLDEALGCDLRAKPATDEKAHLRQ